MTESPLRSIPILNVPIGDIFFLQTDTQLRQVGYLNHEGKRVFFDKHIAGFKRPRNVRPSTIVRTTTALTMEVIFGNDVIASRESYSVLGPMLVRISGSIMVDYDKSQRIDSL